MTKRLTQFVTHERQATADCPAGLTITRGEQLPPGDFMVTEYSWPDMTLWFLDADEFDSDERQAVYVALIGGGEWRREVPR